MIRRETTTKTMGPQLLPMGRLAAGLLEFGLRKGTDGRDLDRFLSCLMLEEHPEAAPGLFQLCKGLIRTWAGMEDLSRPDDDMIEQSRKICDVMGWPPADR